MVNLEYVKKRKRKKIAAAVSGISAIVVVTFVLLSFLGQNLGSFTINLKGTGVSLSLSEKSSMENQTSYLQIGSVPPMDTFTYGMLDDSADIDNEETDYLMGAQYNVKGEVVDLNYLKYTFFLSNVGPTIAMYDFSLKFLDNQDGGNVDNTDVKDILRIGLYSNTEKDEHNVTYYAKKGKNINIVDGKETFNEYVSNTNRSLCTNFADDETVLSFRVKNFAPNSQIRYTVLFWLEGSDPDCTGVPKDESKVRLGIEINAYENQE